MVIIQRTGIGQRIDEDTIRYVDRLDTDLSHYFEINIDDTNNLIDFLAKIGDFRFKDADDSSNTDIFQITGDPAASGIIKKTSNITDSVIFEIETSGIYDGSGATVDIDYFLFDIDGTTINDGAANAVTLRGMYMDWDGITMTAVGLSSITGISMLLPSSGELATERGILVTADKSIVSNNAIALETSRDMGGTLAAAESFTNYANIFGQAVAHSGGDFILTADEGVLKLVMSYSGTVAMTSPDVFSSTGLYIDIDADVNVGTSDAKVDVSARGLDIAYTIAETDGVTRLAATDIARIVLTIPAGITSAGAFNFNMWELNADSVTLNDANITFKGLDFDASGLTLTDAAAFYGLYINIPSVVDGQDTLRAGAMITDGVLTASLVTDSSMGVQGSGMNDTKYFRCEDFDEEAAAVTLDAGLRGDEWTFGGTNGDAGDVTYIQGTGGLIRLETDGADNDSVYALWLNTAVYITANPIIEFRVRVDAVTASLTGFAVGLAETGTFTTMGFDAADDDYILVGMDSDLGTPANLRMYTEDNNGGITTVDTGVAIAANTWCTIRIDCTDTEQPRIWINNSGGAITAANEVAAATITGTIQDAIYMYPVIFLICLDATPSARHLDVDYIKIWQDRA